MVDNVVNSGYTRTVNPGYRPTMKDVASLAGVSFKTVSRVVNDEAGVSPRRAALVRDAIVALGYQPNHGARSLRSASPTTATIGFIHADIANPFSAAVHGAFETVASANGCLILSGSSAEQPAHQDELIRAFAGRRVDGLVVIPVGETSQVPSPALAQEIERGTPLVFIDRDPGFVADLVMSDHRGGARLATEHLLSYGHRRLAFLGSREHVHSVIERRSGFEQVVARASASAVAIMTGLRTPDDATRAVGELLARPVADQPTAIFAAQNGLALGTVRALHQLRRHHDVALVGFDDFDAVDIVEPGVTTVPQDAEQLGRLAGELLFSRLRGGRTEPVRHIVALTIVPRGSGEIAAATPE